ncbi:hypothetical protein QCA50_018896 [Cerrena zonata]|uniref:Uncharacterized protein n=1 Tax=Cerrena zonata TaxID=2478898 RepID=A0AAW0FBP7_9APHY
MVANRYHHRQTIQTGQSWDQYKPEWEDIQASWSQFIAHCFEPEDKKVKKLNVGKRQSTIDVKVKQWSTTTHGQPTGSRRKNGTANLHQSSVASSNEPNEQSEQNEQNEPDEPNEPNGQNEQNEPKQLSFDKERERNIAAWEELLHLAGLSNAICGPMKSIPKPRRPVRKEKNAKALEDGEIDEHRSNSEVLDKDGNEGNPGASNSHGTPINTCTLSSTSSDGSPPAANTSAMSAAAASSTILASGFSATNVNLTGPTTQDASVDNETVLHPSVTSNPIATDAPVTPIPIPDFTSDAVAPTTPSAPNNTCSIGASAIAGASTPGPTSAGTDNVTHVNTPHYTVINAADSALVNVPNSVGVNVPNSVGVNALATPTLDNPLSGPSDNSTATNSSPQALPGISETLHGNIVMGNDSSRHDQTSSDMTLAPPPAFSIFKSLSSDMPDFVRNAASYFLVLSSHTAWQCIVITWARIDASLGYPGSQARLSTTHCLEEIGHFI